MVQQYREDDGMDPGLKELAYDGAEYVEYEEYDVFGERIESDDDLEDELLEDELMEDTASETETATETDRTEGFGETLTPDSMPEKTDQAEDKDISSEGAQDTKTDSAADEPMADPEKSDAP